RNLRIKERTESMKPVVQYTKSDHINIAYQVFGSGTVDLIYIPGWVSNIDWMWACPELVHFLQELGKVARVILFDKRGTGLSDRVVKFSTLEERMDDIRAVMDAVGSEKAILFGHSEGGSVAALFAATYPNRVISLITFGIFAKRRYSSDYPWAPTDEERQKVYDMIENNWGGGAMGLETLAPSKAHDQIFMNWLASYFRSGASPRAAIALTKMNTEVNIVDILSAIRVPTLIMQRTDDIDVKIEEGKFIAQHIKGSKFAAFEGDDHLFWVGNTQEVLEEIKAFILDIKPNNSYKKGLFTVVVGQIITTVKSDHQFELTDRFIRQYKGKIIRYDGKNFVAAFKGPGKAVRCSMELLGALQDLNTSLAIGIYMREGVQDGTDLSNDEEDNIAHSMRAQITPNQVLITQTVRHLLAGTGFDFTQHTTIVNPISCNVCTLYWVTDDSRPNNRNESANPNHFSHHDSFLEDVLQIIDKHLDNDTFGVEMLSREMRVSERQLQRKIKAMTNKSPNQLITSVRLRKAKEILMLQRYTIAEIAFQSGFSSPSYFSKCFKKEFGIRPTSML
ncbi:MAG: alpha/beta fold hydrolase, partial [Bacteroidota bacterium]